MVALQVAAGFPDRVSALLLITHHRYDTRALLSVTEGVVGLLPIGTLQRLGVRPQRVVELLDRVRPIDCRVLAPRVSVPALVLVGRTGPRQPRTERRSGEDAAARTASRRARCGRRLAERTARRTSGATHPVSRCLIPPGFAGTFRTRTAKRADVRQKVRLEPEPPKRAGRRRRFMPQLEGARYATGVDRVGRMDRRGQMQPGEGQRLGQFGLALGAGPALAAVDLEDDVPGEILLARYFSTSSAR